MCGEVRGYIGLPLGTWGWCGVWGVGKRGTEMMGVGVEMCCKVRRHIGKICKGRT